MRWRGGAVPLLALATVLAAALAAARVAMAARTAAAPPVRSVAAVDLARYSGRWYEIASFPMFFERHCVADVTADYEPAADGNLTVRNRCRTASGHDAASGRARVVPGHGNSRLEVSFFWPFEADYWILGLDPAYRWAVVGDPNRKYLWILARTPQLPAAQQEAALAVARAQGYDLTRLHMTPQTAAQPH
ncbi:MAG: lipocalin family protein [Burkholderiales bacterium]|nr:lipocalin family protein [Burkholderiales bacterium]MDE2502714.1 lipocalin family protein [Burkholderiales bacterium]